MQNITYKQWEEELLLSAKEMRVPVVGQFELTACCNLDCKMCYIHNADSNALHERELPTDTWLRIFDEAYDMGLMFATLTGGECLLRPDFKKIYLHLWEKSVRIEIFTNGTLIDDEYIDFFKKYPPRKIRISLYGSSEEAYLKVTGHKGFQKAITAYKQLLASKIPVGVSVTPSSYMKDDYMNIRRFCLDNDIACPPANYYLLKNRENPDKDDYNLTIDEIISIETEIALQKGALVSMDNPPKPGGSCTEAPVGLGCNAGCGAAFVSWDGTMHPCGSLHEGTATLLKMSYAEAWEKTKALVDKVLRPAECVGCPYDSVCPRCPVMRSTSAYSGHCNPDVCELARRFIETGIKQLSHTAEDSE